MENDIVTIQLADFGHSTAVPVEHEDQLVYLPESQPWSIPPNEYHHRGFTFVEAKRAMTYSLSVCCMWLLFYNRSNEEDLFFTTSIRCLNSCTMLDTAMGHLDDSPKSLQECGEYLKELFRLTLAADPQARWSSVVPVLEILRHCMEILVEQDKPHQAIVSDKPPKSVLGVDLSTLQDLPDGIRWLDVRTTCHLMCS
jgi:hypothetical protein